MKNPDSNAVIKVAIADDHALFRTGVKTSLQARKDIQMVAEAENGMQLMNLLRHIQPDVVLLDIQMPGLDGFEFVARTRADAALRPTPAILMTSLAGAEHRRRGAEVGARLLLDQRLRAAGFVSGAG